MGHNNLELLRNNRHWGHFGIVPCTSFGQLKIGCWFPSRYRTNLLFELTDCLTTYGVHIIVFPSKVISTYIISLGGRPFHPSVPSSVHPSSSSRKKKMMEREEDDDSWRREQCIHMFCVENLAGERNGSISCRRDCQERRASRCSSRGGPEAARGLYNMALFEAWT